VETRVTSIAPEIDLAVSTIDPTERDLFDERPALPLTKMLPKVLARVAVKGSPLGVKTTSTTQGIVSRIE
jgi:hypothetical protein